MEGKARVGVFICHCGLNIAGVVDVEEVTKFAQELPNVVVAKHYMYMCSDPGQNMIKDDIKQLGLNRVVVASCSPMLHEHTFRVACQEAGLNPYLFEMANIREQDAWVTADHKAATEKAKELVSAAVAWVVYQEPLEVREVPVNPNVMVVGGGIAGIRAALEVANSGHKVYLVEREPTIGGHMAQFDKTFPTLDCASCIFTPLLSEVGRSSYIELMSYSEVEEVSGYIGNFKARIRKKSSYINAKECTGCGECPKVCPVEVLSEFDLGLARRKAIYRPFPQAVPNVFTIDKRGLPPCRAACPAGVNAQGYVALISQGKFKEALEVVRRTMPFAAVCGRVCTHRCETECERGKVDEPISIRSLKRFISDYEIKAGREKAAPVELTKKDKVAIIGSGPAGLACAYDLVRKGYPVTVFEAEAMAGGLLRWGIPEYRLPKKTLDDEIEYIKELGVEIKTSTRVKDLKELTGQGYKAVFLGTGAGKSQKMNIPGEDTKGVIHALDFLKEVNAGEKVELGDRVVVTGGGNAAVDSARVAKRFGVKEVAIVYRRSRVEMPAAAEEVDEAEREGIKLNILATPVKVLSQDGRLTGIECTRMELGEPDASGRRRPIPIKGSEFTMDVDNLILAVGQSVDKSVLPEGLEYTNRGTLSVDPVTYKTNVPGVFAGGDVVEGPADVISAIAAGKEAAESIDRYLSGLDLKEGRPAAKERVKDVSKEGVETKARAKMPMIEPEKRESFVEVELGFDEKTAIEEAKRCLSCAVCSECLECVKVCERKAINHQMEDELVEVDIGSIIVATGYDSFDPSVISQYGYGRYDNVITALQFERLSNASGPTLGQILLKDGSKPKSVAIVHCVGSRDTNYHKYCSRVCCMYALKYSHLIHEKTNAEVYQMYIDMRCYGKGYEEFYERLSNEGVNFIRGKVAKVTDEAQSDEEKGKLIVVCEDTLLGAMIRVPVDMVVLCTALEPRADAGDVARLFNINRSADGFFLERHPKLDPVATMNDGMFVVGCCQGPKDIPDTVAQASAAAARVLAMISKGTVEVEAATAFVDEEVCNACGLCVSICAYRATEIDEKLNVARVNEALCKGCGACAATCPSKAIKHKNWTPKQFFEKVDVATREY